MEPVNGLELLKAIRVGSPNVRRGLPVIMVTNHSATDLVGSALALDANGFLAKPISAEMLCSRIARVLGDSTPLRPALAYSVVPTRPASSAEPKPAPSPDYDAEFRARGFATASAMKQPRTAKPPAPAPSDPRRMICCTLEEVPAGSILARDFTSRSGATLLTASNKLTERMLTRLRDLVDIETVVNQVWIYDADPGSD
jgi:DNA-binding response OmpR family regulator